MKPTIIIALISTITLISCNNISNTNNTNLKKEISKANLIQKKVSLSYIDGPDPKITYSIPDTAPEKNLATNLALRKKVLGSINLPKKVFDKNAIYLGAKIGKINNPKNNLFGVAAGHAIQPDLTLPKEFTLSLYAPTLMPPNKAVLESTTAYYNWILPDKSTTRAWGIWQHDRATNGQCWVQFNLMTNDWQKTYTHTYADGQFYFTKIYKTNPATWTAELYNFERAAWEEKYTINRAQATTVPDYGWDAFEPKWQDYCHTLPTIKATNIKVWDGNNWYDNVATNNGADLLSFMNSGTCPNWNYLWLNKYYGWQVN